MTPAGRPKPPNAGKGRKKGSVNKVTASVKAALVAAFDKLGGVPALVKWAKKEPAEFYRLWGRLAPAEVKLGGDGENGELVIRVTHE